jgi:hypothetical protein
MVSLERLLALNPGEVVRRVIYHSLMSAARAAGDPTAFVSYGESLLRLSPQDGETLTKVALALADQKRALAKALRYARRADEATRELPTLTAEPNDDFLKSYYSEESRRERHKARRAQALDARGWVLFRKEHGLNFPLLYDDGTAKLYGVHSFPTTIFIDRAGNMRYQTLGFYPETATRDLEIIIDELLTSPATSGAEITR